MQATLQSPLDIATFISANRDDGRCLWFFQHIPKSAGSSFRVELADILGNDQNGNVRANYDDLSTPLDAQLDFATDAFITYNGVRRLRFGSGHLYQPQIDRIAKALAPVRLITMLRDPVDRLISEYRYSITPTHPPHREFFARYPTIEHYVAEAGYQNMMATFLRRSPDEPAQRIVRRLERDYAFVGVVELYPLCFRMITTLLGAPSLPRLRLNATSHTEANALAVGPALRRRIEACNGVDCEIYQNAFDRLRARRDAMLHYFEQAHAARPA